MLAMLWNHFKYETKAVKLQLVWEKGVYLACRREPNFVVFLYQLGGFYTEVYFDIEENEPGYLRTFHSVEELEPYLAQIDISSLIR
jgi:hypothetical protein